MHIHTVRAIEDKVEETSIRINHTTYIYKHTTFFYSITILLFVFKVASLEVIVCVLGHVDMQCFARHIQ